MCENLSLQGKTDSSRGRNFEINLMFRCSILFFICFAFFTQCANSEDKIYSEEPIDLNQNEFELDKYTEKTIDPSISVEFLKHDLTLELQEQICISYIISGLSTTNISELDLQFNSSNKGILDNLQNITVRISNDTQEEQLNLTAQLNGYTLLTINVSGMSPNMTNLSDAFLRVSVYESIYLYYLSDIVGWTYFIVWSISFYPQIFLNWKRKSVIGLHFDFLSLNIVGFLLYSIFNIGLYFIPEIEKEYFERHPFGVNPVQLNDVIFSVHAFFACVIQVIQCLIYEKGDQKISQTGRTLLGLILSISIAMLIFGSVSLLAWIDFLYFLSYIKLFITLIKYIPQAYYNYLRKSTSGWSIGNILLDFTGGTLSICQMFILAFNFNDWSSIFGDPTKFGLGLFSIMFDIFFIIQHYILYKSEKYMPLTSSPVTSRSSSANSGHPNYGALSDIG